MVQVKFKKLHEKAKIPHKADKFSAGFDITAVDKNKVYDTNGNLQYVQYFTGLSMEIPPGYAGFIYPRSSITNYDLSLGNSVGIVDASYRGELTFRFRALTSFVGKEYEVGDRIGQLVIMPYPEVHFDEVNELSETERGKGGYGSSGK